MKDYLKKKLGGHTIRIFEESLSPKNLDPRTQVIGGFVKSKFTKEVIQSLQKLELIATLSTGYDHIDLSAAKARHIAVCNVPTYGEHTVAEHTLALILALTRKLFPALKRVKEGQYDVGGLRGMDIKGKTIGVIGTGHIGMHLIQLLLGFEATVVAYDPSPKKEKTRELHFRYVTLSKLFALSDIISVHVPLTKETHHLINKTAIKKMKKGVYLINTARGGIIESSALVWGLDNAHIGGVGLDVLEDEDIMQSHEELVCGRCSPELIRTSLMNNMIIDHPNTIVTPHNAFNSTEAIKRIIDTTVDNVRGFLKGKIQNRVA